jgi:surfeit locus 1 family protein
VPTIVAVLFLVLFTALGFWQLDRSGEKRELVQRHLQRAHLPPLDLTSRWINEQPATGELGGLRYRPVRLRGRFDASRQYLLDNRTHEGVAGYYVYTPLTLSPGGRGVLVNRGWIATGASREQLPEVGVPSQVTAITGHLSPAPRPGPLLGPDGYGATAWPRVVQKVDLAVMEEQLGKTLFPLVVRLAPDSRHGYIRDWQAHYGISPERHQGYAVQWFALATALVLLYAWLTVKRAPGEAPP